MMVRMNMNRALGWCAAVAALTAAALWYFGVVGGKARSRGYAAAPTAPAKSRVLRTARDALTVPEDVQRSLGVRVVAAKPATASRRMPALKGTLAIDNNLLARVHSRFAGQVVTFGTLDHGETDAFAPAAHGRRALQVGDEVVEGQLLVVVWSQELGEKKSDLMNALSQLRLDRESLTRLKSLSDGVVAQKQIREAERAVEASLIAVAKAEATLRSWRVDEAEIQAVATEAERLTKTGDGRPGPATSRRWARVEVRAPCRGVILEKNTHIGDVITTDEDLFKIADLHRLRVWVSVYEDDLGLIQSLPQPIRWTLHVPSWPEFSRAGTVEHLGALIDPTQHTALVTGLIDNADGRLKAGQFITANLDLPAAMGEVEIPSEALVEDGRESIVFIQPDPTKPEYRLRHVQVSRRFQDVVYLTGAASARRSDRKEGRDGGVCPGERVVSGGAVVLRDALQELPAP